MWHIVIGLLSIDLKLRGDIVIRSRHAPPKGCGEESGGVARWYSGEKRFSPVFLVVVIEKLLGSIPIFQAKIRMMLAQKETIEKELAKLQVVVHITPTTCHIITKIKQTLSNLTKRTRSVKRDTGYNAAITRNHDSRRWQCGQLGAWSWGKLKHEAQF